MQNPHAGKTRMLPVRYLYSELLFAAVKADFGVAATFPSPTTPNTLILRPILVY